MHYNFDEYLNSVKYLDREDILETSYKKHKDLDKLKVVDKKEGGQDLQSNISFLLYFLEKAERPMGMSDANFAKLKPLCENLVKKKQLKEQVLSFF